MSPSAFLYASLCVQLRIALLYSDYYSNQGKWYLKIQHVFKHVLLILATKHSF